MPLSTPFYGTVYLKNTLVTIRQITKKYNNITFIHQENVRGKNKIGGSFKGRKWLSYQLEKFNKINAVKFDIKLLGDDGILKTLNTYNALYHDKCKNDYGKAELDR